MELITKNIPLHEYLRENARRNPEKTAIIYYGKRISYKELDLYSDRFASFLTHKGVRKGDKVALFMQNSPQYIISHFAIQKLGAMVGPCNPMFKEWELEYELNDLKAKVVVTLDNLYPIVEKIRGNTNIEEVVVTNYSDFLPEEPIPSFPEKIIEKKPIEQTYDLIHIISNENLPNPPSVNINMEDDVGLVVYTSGTTGAPKGAMLTFKNAEFKTNCIVKCYDFTANDVFLSVMPIFHIAGMLVGMNSPIAVGATIVLFTRFDPKGIIEAIEKYNVTVAYKTPPMVVEIMNQPMIEESNLKSLRLNLSTSFGIQVTEKISNKWKKYSGVDLFEFAYGMSETHTADAMMPPNAIKYGSVGKPTFSTKIKIVSLEDKSIEMSIGEQGEILVKSPSVFKGYLDKPEATKKSLIDGWFHTGDIGKIDEDGYLYFLGRNKEMIKCSGYSVFPEEVEKMLINHPAVSQAAVIGVPDDTRGESVKAYIVLNKVYTKQITEEEIIKWSKEKMAAYKYPRHVEFIDSLPTTSTGKVLRRLLKTDNIGKKQANKK